MPNLENVRIPVQKLTGYALNPDHNVGKHKAIVFQSALGFNQSNYGDLLDQIIINMNQYSATPQEEKPQGQTYRVDFPVTGPNGATEMIQTGWIDDVEIKKLRLVTVLVKGR